MDNPRLVKILLLVLSELTFLAGIELSLVYYFRGSVPFMVVTYIIIITYCILVPFILSFLMNKKVAENRALNHILIFGLYITSASLVFATSFAQSPYEIFGYDINGELFFANKVLEDHYWDAKINHPYNSVLSVTFLAPIISLVTSLSNLFILKIIYPSLFSLIFILLYKVVTSRMNTIAAYFSTLFFLYLFTNFTEMLALGRQMIAEFLLVTILFLIILQGNRVNLAGNLSAYIILLLGLALSHYSTAFIFSYVLIAGMVFVELFSKVGLEFNIPSANKKKYNILFLLFAFITYLWYTNVTEGANFLNLLGLFKAIFIHLNEIFNPTYSQAYSAIIMPTTLGRDISRLVNLIGLAFIVLGFLAEINLFVKKRLRGIWAYYAIQFSLPFFILDVFGFFVPFLSNALNATRLYQISLIVLFPYFYTGWEFLGNLFSNITHQKKKSEYKTTQRELAPLLVFFITLYVLIYAVANTGILLYLFRDPQPATWLNQIASPSWKLPETYTVKWIVNNIIDKNNIIIATYDFNFPLLLRYNILVKVVKENKTMDLPKNITILYFSGKSIEAYGVYPLLKYYGSAPYVDLAPLYQFVPFIEISRSSRVYSTNLSAVYLLR